LVPRRGFRPVIRQQMRYTLSEIGGLFSILAILAAPIAVKLPFGPVPLSLTDLLLAAGIALAAAGRLRWPHLATETYCLEPCAPFLAAMTVAALASHEITLAVKELLQVLLYAAGGVWLFSAYARDARWRVRCFYGIRAAIVFALAGLAVQRACPATPAAAWFANSNSLACLAGTLACLLAAAEFPVRRLRRSCDHALIGIALCAVVFCLVWPPVALAPAQEVALASEAIPQRFLEAYAALSVLSSHPLTGVGLGSYQTYIGAYFQGMPKENSIAPGGQIGYCIVLASTGMCGLAACLYWLYQLHLWAWRCSSRPLAMMAAPAFLVLVGLVTPILVAQILAPLALAHGLLWNRKEEECAKF
jgi:hypothetical protein